MEIVEEIPTDEFADKEDLLLDELGLLDNKQDEEETTNYISSYKMKKKSKVIGEETVRKYIFSNSINILNRDYNIDVIKSIIEEKVINFIETDSSISEDQLRLAQQLLNDNKIYDIIKILNIGNKILTNDLFSKIYNEYILSVDEKIDFDNSMSQYQLNEKKEIDKIKGETKVIEKGLYSCKKCGSFDVKISLSQIRRADEPETMFVDCNICKSRQKHG